MEFCYGRLICIREIEGTLSNLDKGIEEGEWVRIAGGNLEEWEWESRDRRREIWWGPM